MPVSFAEKAFAHATVFFHRRTHAVANELTLVGMSDMYSKIGRPGVADKERVRSFRLFKRFTCGAIFKLHHERVTPSSFRSFPPVSLRRCGWPWTTRLTRATTPRLNQPH